MTEQQKIEHLMRPRYKQTGPYPGSKTDPGTIFYKHVFTETGNYVFTTNLNVPISGDNLRKDEVEGCPNLFQPMNWWEDRKPEEIPEYVRYAETGEVRKVIGFDLETASAWCMYLENDPQPFAPGPWVPTTKAEYESFMAKAGKIK